MPMINFLNFSRRMLVPTNSLAIYLFNVPFDTSNKDTEKEIRKTVLFTMASEKASNKPNQGN